MILQFTENIGSEQFLDDLVPLHLHDETSGALVAGNEGGISRHNITDDLIGGAVPLLYQSVINNPKDLLRAHLIILCQLEILRIF